MWLLKCSKSRQLALVKQWIILHRVSRRLFFLVTFGNSDTWTWKVQVFTNRNMSIFRAKIRTNQQRAVSATHPLVSLNRAKLHGFALALAISLGCVYCSYIEHVGPFRSTFYFIPSNKCKHNKVVKRLAWRSTHTHNGKSHRNNRKRVRKARAQETLLIDPEEQFSIAKTVLKELL